jgi:hypothetical protein
MKFSRMQKILAVSAWFIGLFIFNIIWHWSQIRDASNPLYILAVGLETMGTPLELVLSIPVVYSILGKVARRGLYTAIIVVAAPVAVVLLLVPVDHFLSHLDSQLNTSQPAPYATLPTLAHLKAQMKEDSPGMSPREFKQMRAATGIARIMDLHKMSLGKDHFKSMSALYLADGTVCYEYAVTDAQEYGVLTTDGLLYVNAPAPWKQLCEGEKGEEMAETPKGGTSN